MADILADFDWPVASAYKAVAMTVDDDPDDLDTTRVGPVEPRLARPGERHSIDAIAEAGPEVRRYHPFSPDHAFLFRRFASFDGSMDSALKFASVYGLLGVRETGRFEDPSLRVRAQFGNKADVVHEIVAARRVHVSNWKRCAAVMREALELYDQVSKNTASDLRKWMEQSPVWARNTQRLSDPRLLLERDVTEAAWFVIAEILTQQLQGHTGPVVRMTEPHSRPRLSHEPQDLLGAMWLQFAHDVTKERPAKTCKHCDRLFEISKEPTGARTRSDAEFCSHPCKSADYRRRRKQALTMRASGATLRNIAAAIHTNKTTVKGWIQGKRDRGRRYRKSTGMSSKRPDGTV